MIVGIMPVATLAAAAVMAGALPALGQAAGVLTVATGLAIGLTAPARIGVDQGISSTGDRRVARRIP
jgi:hypothetical protein